MRISSPDASAGFNVDSEITFPQSYSTDTTFSVKISCGGEVSMSLTKELGGLINYCKTRL
jgi:hypothetical protein